MSRIFIEVTQLAHWPGKLTGIPRVMNELSSRFSSQTDAILVTWDGSGFQEITYDMLREREAAHAVVEPSTAQARINLKRIVKAAERRAPALGVARRRLQGKLIVRQKAVTTQESGVAFVAGDILVSLWGIWGDQGYIDALVSLEAKNVKLVEFVYDMLPLVTPQYSGHSTAALQNYASTVYPRCVLLLAISKHTKVDVGVWLRSKQLAVPSIEVFRLGDDFAFSKPEVPNDPAFKAAKIEKTEYILSLGTVEARKNHTLLYYTYKLAVQKGITLPKLVIVGRRGWLTDDIFTLMTTDPETRDSFVFLQNISDEELSWLFSHCLFTIYPSFYEGWGLPIAESVARGVPCIASNTSSMPEVAGNLIDYFSPVSSDGCLAAITQLLQPKKRSAAKEKARQYQPTTWDMTFKTVNARIKELTT
ncbi:MAG TPA: glycosyltransferase family 1 protein [Patescibacteria group bacterium]|nr:glycosyltransferase family 1 protein [Patescibacteria group bacterium]